MKLATVMELVRQAQAAAMKADLEMLARSVRRGGRQLVVLSLNEKADSPGQ